MRILVVDDHELVRRGICSILAGEPTFTVCGEAVDGRNAVEKARALHPDVIIMDITMPNMNGLQATEEIRRLLPETKIVIVSQHEGPEIVRQVFSAGALGYVAKSAVSTDLLVAIAKLGHHETREGLTAAPPDSTSEQEGSIPRKGREGHAVPVPSPSSAPVFNLGSQTYLIDLLPIAAYAVRAPDGVIAWFNSRAAELWGRVPVIGDTEERFCGSHKLYRTDGSYMAHCDTPVALALSTGTPVYEEEVVIERPDGSRVMASVHIDPIRETARLLEPSISSMTSLNESRRKRSFARWLANLKMKCSLGLKTWSNETQTFSSSPNSFEACRTACCKLRTKSGDVLLGSYTTVPVKSSQPLA